MDELLSDGFISKGDIATRCSKQPMLMFFDQMIRAGYHLRFALEGVNVVSQIHSH